MEKKKIAWYEPFEMYVYVYYKHIDEVKDALVRAGFKKIKDKEQGNGDYKLRVTVTPQTSGKAHDIISSIIK